MLPYIYFLIYGDSFVSHYACDAVLSWFKNTDYISFDIIYHQGETQPPPDTNDTITHLSKDGMITIEKYGIRITTKGRIMVDRGGYLRALLYNRLKRLGIIIGVITGVLTLIMYCF